MLQLMNRKTMECLCPQMASHMVLLSDGKQRKAGAMRGANETRLLYLSPGDTGALGALRYNPLILPWRDKPSCPGTSEGRK